MKKLSLATASTIAVLVPVFGSANARELAACNSAMVVETLASAIRPSFIVEVEDYEKTDGIAKKRWCYTYFSSAYLPNGGYRMGSPWQEAIYTVEWTNETEGRYWLQVIQQGVYRKYGDSRDYHEIKRKGDKWVSTHLSDPPPLQEPVKGEIIQHQESEKGGYKLTMKVTNPNENFLRTWTCTYNQDGRKETISVEVLPYVADYTVKFISKVFKPGDQASCESKG